MPGTIAREEFEGRMGALEAEVEGEKVVTRHILEQTRRNGDDIGALKTRLTRVEDKVDQLDRKVGQLDRTVRQLVKDMPTMIASTLREVFAERDRKR